LAVAAAAPLNDAFATPQAISGAQGDIQGSNAGATKEPNEPDHAAQPGGASVWYRWTAPGTGVVTIDTSGSDFDTLLAVYTGDSVDALTEVASSDDDLTISPRSKVAFDAVGGTTYRIVVDGYSGATGSLSLRWRLSTGPPPNDRFDAGTVISGAKGSITGTNGGAGKETGEPDHAGNPGGASVWYRWTAPGSGPVRFDTGGSDFDTLLAVYTGDAVNSLSEVASNDDDAPIYPRSAVTFDARAGATYRIAVDGYDGAIGTVNLAWDLQAVPIGKGTTTVTPTSAEPGGTVSATGSGATPGVGYVLKLGTTAENCATGVQIGGPRNSAAGGSIPATPGIIPTNVTSGSRYVCFARLVDSSDSIAATRLTVL
jgi:hypothetical protein